MNDTEKKVAFILSMHEKVERLRAIMRAQGVDPDVWEAERAAKKIEEFNKLGGTIDPRTGEFKPGKVE